MDLKPLHILVVDDNRSAAEIVRSILIEVGVGRVTYAATAAEAFETIRRENIDAAILDQNLGKGGQGTELVLRIRKDPKSPVPYLPIIMLTGYADERRVTAARDAGVTEFLVKPFTAAALIKRIEALIMNARPFVRSADYFGPDRRRRADLRYVGPERRKARAPVGPELS